MSTKKKRKNASGDFADLLDTPLKKLFLEYVEAYEEYVEEYWNNYDEECTFDEDEENFIV